MVDRTLSRLARTIALSSAALAALTAGCADGAPGPQTYTGGWPAIHGDARNSNTSTVTGSPELTLSWNRPVGGPIATTPGIGPSGQMVVTTRTDVGCNLFSYEMESGRMRYCNRLGPGVIATAPLIDDANNAYLGDNGSVDSFNEHGQPRWRTEVVGTPISQQFTPDENLLIVTHRGQIQVLSTQTGLAVSSPYNLLAQLDPLTHPNYPRPLDDVNLQDCFAGTQACPVANTTAVDERTGKFYLTLWKPGAAIASLVALQYDSSGGDRIKQLWSADILTAGSATSPNLSADGTTVYVSDNANKMYAVNASNGSVRWTTDLGFTPLGSAAVDANGLIIPAAGRNGWLRAYRDDGDHAEPIWERRDVTQAGVPALAAGNVGYTVIRPGHDPQAQLQLLAFNPETGATLSTSPMPGAVGATIGTAIGPQGQVVTATLIGELYMFTPKPKG